MWRLQLQNYGEEVNSPGGDNITRGVRGTSSNRLHMGCNHYRQNARIQKRRSAEVPGILTSYTLRRIARTDYESAALPLSYAGEPADVNPSAGPGQRDAGF